MRTRVGAAALLLTAVLVSQLSGRVSSEASDPLAELMAKVQAQGAARVIVHLDTPFIPEDALPTPAHVLSQRADIARLRAAVRASLRGLGHTVGRHDGAFPVMALEVGPDALRVLAALRGVVGVGHIEEDALATTMLAESVPLIQGDQAWGAGVDGAGQIVAILDTGVDKNHPFLAGKVVGEA